MFQFAGKQVRDEGFQARVVRFKNNESVAAEQIFNPACEGGADACPGLIAAPQCRDQVAIEFGRRQQPSELVNRDRHAIIEDQAAAGRLPPPGGSATMTSATWN